MANNLIIFEEILISLTFNVNDNVLEQIFSFNKRNKAAKYIKDHRYILYNKFEKRIRELSLFVEGTLFFIKRVDESDYVKLIYEIQDIESFREMELKPTNFKLVEYTPPNPGCAFCKYKELMEEKLWFYCIYKKKTMTNEFKTCKYFKQKRLFKS